MFIIEYEFVSKGLDFKARKTALLSKYNWMPIDEKHIEYFTFYKNEEMWYITEQNMRPIGSHPAFSFQKGDELVGWTGSDPNKESLPVIETDAFNCKYFLYLKRNNKICRIVHSYCL